MTSAQNILDLISLAKKNSEDLDKIDIMVHAFLGKDLNEKCPQYTRSRDALKLIRPPQWAWSVQLDSNEWASADAATGKHWNKLAYEPGSRVCFDGATEELSELYCIIFAIQYDQQTELNLSPSVGDVDTGPVLDRF